MENKKVLECSSIGDKRFSAFYAYVIIFGTRKTIENHYQLCKRFGDVIPKTIKEAKGKTPTHIHINGYDYNSKYLTAYYDLLWVAYLDKNEELVKYAKEFDDFHDTFKGKNSINCQADSIRKYIKNGRESILEEHKEFIKLIRKNNKGDD